MIINDPRAIRGVTSESTYANVAFVGQDGVTKIVVYAEAGQMGPVPAVEIWRGDDLATKHILASGESVHYLTEE